LPNALFEVFAPADHVRLDDRNAAFRQLFLKTLIMRQSVARAQAADDGGASHIASIPSPAVIYMQIAHNGNVAARKGVYDLLPVPAQSKTRTLTIFMTELWPNY
jgi:hypothetical protein